MKNKTLLMGVGWALVLLLILAIYYMTAFTRLGEKITDLKQTRQEYKDEYGVLAANIGNEDVLQAQIDAQQQTIEDLKGKLSDFNAVNIADFLFDAESKAGVIAGSASVGDVVWYTNRVSSEGRCLCSSVISQTFTVAQAKNVDGEWLVKENDKPLATVNTETGEVSEVSASSLSITQNDKQALYFTHLFEDASSGSAFYVNSLTRSRNSDQDVYTLNYTYYFYASEEESASKIAAARAAAEAAADDEE